MDLLKKEAEKQRLLREDVEMELQRLKDRILVMESALEETNSRNADELEHALSTLRNTERCWKQLSLSLSKVAKRVRILHLHMASCFSQESRGERVRYNTFAKKIGEDRHCF